MLNYQMGDASDDSSFSTGSLISLATAGLTAYDAQLVVQTNATRAAQGLPPISAASLSPGVNIGLDPGLQSMLMIGGALLLLVMFARK